MHDGLTTYSHYLLVKRNSNEPIEISSEQMLLESEQTLPVSVFSRKHTKDKIFYYPDNTNIEIRHLERSSCVGKFVVVQFM